MMIILLLLFLPTILTKIINFQSDKGAIPDDSSLAVALKNRDLMNSVIYDLVPGDKFFIPNNTFHLMGGVKFNGMDSITIQHTGTLIFSDNLSSWPIDEDNNPLDCFHFYQTNNLTFTSSDQGWGRIDGSGSMWWGIPFIGYLIRGENRPKLFHMKSATNIMLEKIIFTNSPYWTVHIEDVKGLIIRNTSIINKRTQIDRHSLIDLSAFNTDGFDITGEDVHIHDCNIWTQDDCIAVKGNSKNMLFERINASGLGLTIGSIGSQKVHNITFRNCYMHNTVKGIYLKFNSDADDFPGGSISNILYENITIESPSEYAIWIGPAQQSDSSRLCYANPCSLCWPMLSPWVQCNIPRYGNFSNITLTNITIINPQKIVGVLLASSTNWMKNILFNNVLVNNYTEEKYICSNVHEIIQGTTLPRPNC